MDRYATPHVTLLSTWWKNVKATRRRISFFAVRFGPIRVTGILKLMDLIPFLLPHPTRTLEILGADLNKNGCRGGNLTRGSFFSVVNSATSGGKAPSVWQRCHDVQVVFLPSFERLWKRSSRTDQLFFLPLKNTARLFKSCSRIVDFPCGQHWNELQSLGYRYTPPRLSITNAKNSYIFCLRSTIDKGLHLMTF